MTWTNNAYCQRSLFLSICDEEILNQSKRNIDQSVFETGMGIVRVNYAIS